MKFFIVPGADKVLTRTFARDRLIISAKFRGKTLSVPGTTYHKDISEPRLLKPTGGQRGSFDKLRIKRCPYRCLAIK